MSKGYYNFLQLDATVMPRSYMMAEMLHDSPLEFVGLMPGGWLVDIPPLRSRLGKRYTNHCRECGVELEDHLLLLRTLPYTCPTCGKQNMQCWRLDVGPLELIGTPGQPITIATLTIVTTDEN